MLKSLLPKRWTSFSEFRKLVVWSNSFYALIPIILFFILPNSSTTTFEFGLFCSSMVTLSATSWLYHYYDTWETAVFDHFGMIMAFTSINIILHNTLIGFHILIMGVATCLMVVLPDKIELKAFKPIKFDSIFIPVGILSLLMFVFSFWTLPLHIFIGCVVIFGVAFYIQRYAEEFKYDWDNVHEYELWHSIWHFLTSVGFVIIIYFSIV